MSAAESPTLRRKNTAATVEIRIMIVMILYRFSLNHVEKSSDLDGENRFGRLVVGSDCDCDLGFWGFESRLFWTNIGSNLTPIQFGNSPIC